MINSAIFLFKDLHLIISERIQYFFGNTTEAKSVFNYSKGKANFFKLLLPTQPTFFEQTILLLALTPHLSPGFFRSILAEHLPDGGDFPEFGGVKGKNHRDILPTGETAQFILAGDDLEKRLEIQRLFGTDHWFYKKNILHLEEVPYGEPAMSGRIILDPEVVELLTLGNVSKPRFSTDFPAEYITTGLEWDELVLSPATMRQIKEIESWVSHQKTFFESWGMNRRVRPGYRVLFYGPPGTGKTLTASLLGKYTGRDVFKIDLSMVVSKYIGETEKNLARLFDKAQNKDWILFFDEADSLFGKRTQVQNAHDRYANQEVSFLLQRIENFNGLVILASNFKSNIDEAFLRRFQSIISFPPPNAYERLILWEKSFPGQLKVCENASLKYFAEKFELTGAEISNIVQNISIRAISQDQLSISNETFHECIKLELLKTNKVI